MAEDLVENRLAMPDNRGWKLMHIKTNGATVTPLLCAWTGYQR
jgi:hypothetical protein